MGEDEVLVLVGDLEIFGNTALQLAVSTPPLFCTRAPSAPEWHSNLVDGGMPPSESSSAGSPPPASPLSSGSSRKIARGFGRPSAR